MLSENSQPLKALSCMVPFKSLSQNSKIINVENRLVVAGSREESGNGSKGVTTGTLVHEEVCILTMMGITHFRL